MNRFFYMVTATVPDRATGDRYETWLLNGHVQAVIAAGACDARVVRLLAADGPIQVQTLYEFPSQEAFSVYEKSAAPRLRAEGAALFPPSSGVKFARSTGEVLGRCQPACS